MKASLIRHEQRCLTSYKDTRGNITVGVGHNITANGITITDELCDRLLSTDLTRTMDTVDVILGWIRDLDEVRQRVIYEMAFNMGIKNLLGFQRMLAHLRAGEYEAASIEILDSDLAEQVKGRAVEWALIMRTGTDQEGL